jgi:hypothetical protein
MFCLHVNVVSAAQHTSSRTLAKPVFTSRTYLNSIHYGCRNQSRVIGNMADACAVFPLNCCLTPCSEHPQVDAKLSEEMLRQELSDQQADAAAATRAQLQAQQQQLEAVTAGLSDRLEGLQAAVKSSDAQHESKVRRLGRRCPGMHSTHGRSTVACNFLCLAQWGQPMNMTSKCHCCHH